MPIRSCLSAFAGAMLLAFAPVAPVAAQGAAAAMTQLLASQEAVLVLLGGIEDATGLEAVRDQLAAAVEQAQADALALNEHAAELEASEELEAEFTPRLEELYALRAEVEQGLTSRLDPATLTAVGEIMMGGR
jgi:hypothetical protein